MQPLTAKKKILGLDILRAIAILTVVIGHGKPILKNAGSNFPFIDLPDGVEIFFVLSGFLIGQILLKTNWDSWKELYTFWIRRWLRTLPNYYLFLAINVLCAYLGFLGDSLRYFSIYFVVFLHNFNNSFVGFFWESWSLSIEEWFYLLYPFVLYILYFFPKINSFAKQSIALFLFLLLPLLLRYIKAMQFDAPIDGFIWDIEFRKVVLIRLDAIAFGVLFAYLKQYFYGYFYKSRYYLAVIFCVAIYLLKKMDMPADSLYMLVAYFSVMSLLYAILLPLFDNIHYLPKVLKNIVVWISHISYSMYLSNLLIYHLLIHFISPQGLSLNRAYLLFLAYFALTLLVSWLCYTFVEKKILAYRDRNFISA